MKSQSKIALWAPALAVGATLAASQASAATVTLPFGGGQEVNAANIENYFNGGTDSFGTTGPNDGIVFSTPAENLNAGYNGSGFSGGTGKFENDPSGATSVLYFASVPTGTAAVMNDTAGFSGLSFDYSLLNNTASYASTVQLWSGLNGTGTEVGTLSLAANGTTVACTSTHDEFCTWSSASNQNFTGIAESAVFTGDARTYTEFDQLALNTAVPLPPTLLLMLGGMGGLAFFARRRRMV